jgi:NSS family neurotransmitter:Na+ symporter
MNQRESFSSRLGFILVSAGCAVGLGNVWKFPYICGQYGGAAFIIIYLIFLALLGLPIIICEFAVGRASHHSMALAFDTLETPGSKWHHMKWLTVSGSYLLMMFYTMVGGWMLYYAYKTATGQLVAKSSEQISQSFSDMLGSAPTMLIWTYIAIILAFSVCALGFQKGVEKISKILMSALLVLMIILAIHSVFLSGAGEGIRFYLIPDFNLVREYGFGTVIYAAMSHAFFTLSVGIGSMEIFGSYLDKDRSLFGEAASIACLDTFVALMAGFIIIPACFAYGVNPDSGPSLLFITLPNVFAHMTGGRIWGTCFFLFMSFASLSTIIAVFENLLSYCMEFFNWDRKKAVKVNIPLLMVLSIPAVLGYNLWSGIALMGEGTTIMDAEDFLVSYNLLPLGSMIFVLFCVRKNGWGFQNFMAEINIGQGIKIRPSRILEFYMTYILPLIITIVYLKGYYDTFSHESKPVLIGWMIFAVLLLAAIIAVVFRKADNKNGN